MRFTELLMLAVAGWTAIGTLGICAALMRHERSRALHGLRWIGMVWVVYLAVLVGVSLGQQQRVVALGQEQCYDDMCFAVQGVEQIPVYAGKDVTGRVQVGDGSRLVRVSVKITNKGGKPQSEGLIRAYLIDVQGRRWEPQPGIAGVRLTTKVSGGASVVSEPVFKVPSNAARLRLVLTHGRWQPGLFVIGGSDSWLHKPTVVELGI